MLVKIREKVICKRLADARTVYALYINMLNLNNIQYCVSCFIIRIKLVKLVFNKLKLLENVMLSLHSTDGHVQPATRWSTTKQ